MAAEFVVEDPNSLKICETQATKKARGCQNVYLRSIASGFPVYTTEIADENDPINNFFHTLKK